MKMKAENRAQITVQEREATAGSKMKGNLEVWKTETSVRGGSQFLRRGSSGEDANVGGRGGSEGGDVRLAT